MSPAVTTGLVVAATAVHGLLAGATFEFSYNAGGYMQGATNDSAATAVSS
ncbi:MAG TPA: hypothetical protein VGA31_01395 [Thermoanaerobaculia bacterium]